MSLVATRPNSGTKTTAQPASDSSEASQVRSALSVCELGIVIPAFEAASSVGNVAERALAQAARVVVVDDGSSDGTFEAASAVPGIEVERSDRNQGKGAALRRGFRRLLSDSSLQAVVTIDADGQHLPEEVPKLLAASVDADLVLGSRQHLFRSMYWLRRLSNRFSSRGISFAAGCGLHDVQTGFRLYRRGLLEEIPLTEDRFEAESAVVVRAARRGYRIRSTMIDLGSVDGRPTSHYRPLIDSLRIALAVLAARTLTR